MGFGGVVAGGMFDGYMQADNNRRLNQAADQESAKNQLMIDDAQRKIAEEQAARRLESDILSSGALDQIGKAVPPSGGTYETPDGSTYSSMPEAQAAANADSRQAAAAVASNRPNYLPPEATYAPNTTEVSTLGPDGSPAVSTRKTFSDARSEILSKIPTDYAGLGLERANKIIDGVFAQKQGQLFQKAIADGDLEGLVGSLSHAPDGYTLVGENKDGVYKLGFKKPGSEEYYGGGPREFDSKEHALAEFGTAFTNNPLDFTNFWLKASEMSRRRDAIAQNIASREAIAAQNNAARAEMARLRAESQLAAATARGAGRSGARGSSAGGGASGGLPFKDYAAHTGMYDENGKASSAASTGFMLYQKMRALNPAMATSDAGDAVALKLSVDLALGRAKPKVKMDPITGLWRQVATEGQNSYVVDEMPSVNPSVMGMNAADVKASELGWLSQQRSSDPKGYSAAEKMSNDVAGMRQAYSDLMDGRLDVGQKRLYQMAFLMREQRVGAYKEAPANPPVKAQSSSAPAAPRPIPPAASGSYAPIGGIPSGDLSKIDWSKGVTPLDFHWHGGVSTGRGL